MLLHSINDNIPIPHPPYLGVYQDEDKIETSTKRWIFFGLEPNQEKLTNQWCSFIRQHLEFPKIPLNFWIVLGYSGMICLKMKELIEKRAPQNGCCFHPFCGIYQYPCFCLTLLTPSVGWDNMRYESYPLPSYRWLRNFPCIIILSHKISPCLPISLPVPPLDLPP